MDIDGSLWAIANAGINPNTFVVGTNSTQQQAGLGEMVLKIDGKFKACSFQSSFLLPVLSFGKPIENNFSSSQRARSVREEYN
jgi:hypothetical protein